MASFALGDRVSDSRGSVTYRGTVIRKQGTMFNDKHVLVDWDSYGDNWESPDHLTLIEDKDI
ncbi:hypothetical protein SEA_STROSAHL_90 [Gordonia phage Strosahl]|uniref:Uncharacterized protein n=2 Tax=Soupsvirus strosahl TaxID=2560510 RepID=A0A1B3B197_9CAUD|nr:hypothetical protein BIZ67_gp020 [Gordonia phage Remus]YP_009596291.1 hypothetical protein FDH03_gp020 [Gordonia phage Strosahl]AOE44694.1 hypothetical protein SEA_REMUS_90 [Gordonia phage Remus]AOE44800.1 hypothetical protein SEA_STROSAHL_90 [Gordonia phage Strosahl]